MKTTLSCYLKSKELLCFRLCQYLLGEEIEESLPVRTAMYFHLKQQHYLVGFAAHPFVLFGFNFCFCSWCGARFELVLSQGPVRDFLI